MKNRDIPDVEDCYYKIESLLKEFNCEISYDDELNAVVLFDKDNLKFQILAKYTPPCKIER